MGYLPQPTPEMGEYSVEVRSESFYLRGESIYITDAEDHIEVKHGIYVYPNPYPNGRQGTAEILIEDIPKIRAALDQVVRIREGSKE